MGFLYNRPKNQHGGGGNSTVTKRVNPGAASSFSVAVDPAIIVVASRTVRPTPAISNSIANDPALVFGNVNVNPSAAISTSVAKAPAINGTIINPTNGQYIMGSNGAVPYFFDYAAKWASDAQWRSQILKQDPNTSSTALYDKTQTSKLGTATGANTLPGMRYGDPKYVDLINLVSSPDSAFGFFFNEPCFELTIQAQKTTGPSATGELQAVIPSGVNIYQGFAVRRRAYCSIPEFTALGDAITSTGITYNAGHAPSYKRGPWVGYGTGNGRSGLIGDDSIQSGHPRAAYNLSFNWGTPTNQGFAETTFGVTSGPESRDGQLYLECLRFEQWIDPIDLFVYVAATMYLKADAATVWTQVSPRIVAKTTVSQLNRWFELEWMHKNYNQTRETNLKLAITHAAFFNADQDGLSADPFGFVDYFNKVVPLDPLSITVNSATLTTINATVGLNRYAGSLRVQIDGSFVSGQDIQLDAKDGEYYSPSYTTPESPGTKAISLSGLLLTPGNHTVKVFAINRAGTQISASGPSTTITV